VNARDYLETTNVDERDAPFLVRVHFSAFSWFNRVLGLVMASYRGLWLGIFSRKELQAIDEEFHTRSKREPIYNYYSKHFNRLGLWDWEKEALDDYFAGCRRLLVIGAGGGREVLALERLGYQVDGFEPHPDLVVVANKLLQEEGHESTVNLMSRDECPNTGTTYDGIIIGWQAYSFISGRKHRIALLQQLRAQAQAQSPILLSFFYRGAHDRRYKVAALVANVLRRVLRKEPAEVGDWFEPQYIKFFTRDELNSELSEGGFSCVRYTTEAIGSAVGKAA
jgi:hypothetical protein